MDEELGDGDDDAVQRLRRVWAARLSPLQAPGGEARLRHAIRSTASHPRAPEPEPREGAHVLATAARRTAAWLKLDAATFEAATGLALHADTVPPSDSGCWDRSLAFVQLGGRLERKLGRRGVVVDWLRATHLQLRPTPLAVLGTVKGVQTIHDYLDHFER